jgi:hypothetical protein
MTSSPLPSSDSEGAYPHSYERLGVQHGFHSTVVLFDPSPGSTMARQVTLQVACARKQKHVTPPHTTVFVSPGQTKTAVATCPGRRHLFGGGFQRTDFTARGGDYVTESRAISDKSWSVTGRAFGGFGGELTAIAYCWRSKKPLLTEVSSASASVGTGEFATTSTPSCPTGHIVPGGFSSLAGRPPLRQRRLHRVRRLVGIGDEPFRPERKLHGVRLLPEALASLTWSGPWPWKPAPPRP